MAELTSYVGRGIPSSGGMKDTITVAAGTVRAVQSVPETLSLSLEESYADSFLKHGYYQFIQKTLGDQFHHYFLILQKEDGTSYVQPLFIARQSILEGLPASLKTRFARGMGSWGERFSSVFEIRMLMVGCSTGEGSLAGREADHPEIARILCEALPEVARRLGASLIVFKDFPSKYRSALTPFSSKGYVRVPSFPSCKIDLRYRDFKDYMERALSYKTRKNLRRKFRDAERLGGFNMEVLDDLTPVLDEIYPLYLQVFERSRFTFEVLNKEYLAGVASSFGGAGRFFIWRDSNGKIVAFSLCVQDGKILRDCYLGLDYEIALDAHLYFVSFRDVISWAMENDIEQYYTSGQNYTAKSHLKLELAPLDLYIRHVSPVINFFFKRLARFLEPTRYDRTLEKFPNFRDLR